MKPQHERRAYVCPHKDHVEKRWGYRVFLGPGDPIPRCPDHDRPLVRQENLRYVRPDVNAPVGKSQTKGRK